MKRRFQLWAYGLVGGCIGGGASSVSSWLAMNGAKSMGMDVPALNLSAMKILFLSGVMTHAAAFLMKSPLPPIDGNGSNGNHGNDDGKQTNQTKPMKEIMNRMQVKRAMGGGLMAGLAVVVMWAGLTLLTGCKMFGSNPAPPSAFEQRYYAIDTQVVATAQAQVKTNYVTVTNTVVNEVTKTNEQNQVVLVYATNQVPAQVSQVVTNFVDVLRTNYSYAPNASAKEVTQVAGTLANLGLPGAGGMVTAGLGLLVGLWGQWRSSKSNKLAGTLAQVIQVGREVLATQPQGQAAANEWTNWMRSHQEQQGVIQDVLKLIPNAVNSDAAKGVAQQLLEVMEENKPKTP